MDKIWTKMEGRNMYPFQIIGKKRAQGLNYLANTCF